MQTSDVFGDMLKEMEGRSFDEVLVSLEHDSSMSYVEKQLRIGCCLYRESYYDEFLHRMRHLSQEIGRNWQNIDFLTENEKGLGMLRMSRHDCIIRPYDCFDDFKEFLKCCCIPTAILAVLVGIFKCVGANPEDGLNSICNVSDENDSCVEKVISFPCDCCGKMTGRS